MKTYIYSLLIIFLAMPCFAETFALDGDRTLTIQEGQHFVRDMAYALRVEKKGTTAHEPLTIDRLQRFESPRVSPSADATLSCDGYAFDPETRELTCGSRPGAWNLCDTVYHLDSVKTSGDAMKHHLVLLSERCYTLDDGKETNVKSWKKAGTH